VNAQDFFEYLKHTENVVDCGTCPVTTACAIGQGGNGWKFECCNATAVEQNGLLLIMDCGNNHFERLHDEEEHKCPLCSGQIMEWAERGNAAQYHYVRTVHSLVPVKTRLDVWREGLIKARKKIAEEQARLKEA
jgi:hypothetical protein